MENKDEESVNEKLPKAGSLIHDALEHIEASRNRGTGLTGVPSGFPELDRLTAGWQDSDLIILASRPSMGKSSLAITLARNAAIDFRYPVAIFSLEMSNIQIGQRLISAETELSLTKLKKGDLKDDEFEQLTAKITKLSDAPIYIDDTPGLTITDLVSKAIKLKEDNDIRMIVIDYLQLMMPGSKSKDNREQEISNISRTLKCLAKQLNIPIIALSQLSRAVEQRGGDKRPQLSDLRDSGALEQDADMVLFVYREDYYNVNEPTETPPDSAEIIIAKHRNGPLDSVNLKFLREYAKFVDSDLLLSEFHNYVGNSNETRTIVSKDWDIEEPPAPF